MDKVKTVELLCKISIRFGELLPYYVKKYNILNEKQFPEIGRFDPVAQAIGLRPNQLCEITRSTRTSITTKYYRLCY